MIEHAIVSVLLLVIGVLVNHCVGQASKLKASETSLSDIRKKLDGLQARSLAEKQLINRVTGSGMAALQTRLHAKRARHLEKDDKPWP